MENGFRIAGSYYVEPSLNTITGPAGSTRLEPKLMQVLVCLAAHAGEVVPKERLMRTVWPDTFVGDDVLTRAISELRRVFGDDAKDPRVIQTIPKSGYRLIAEMSSSALQDPVGSGRDVAKEPAPTATQATRRKLMLILVGGVLLTGVAIGGWWIASARRGSAGEPRQPTLTQLTANPPDLPVTSARISPDGKYLAYADPTGIHVRVIDTGETRRIADTRGMEVQAWSGDGTRILAAVCDAATCTGWDLSLLGGTRRSSGAVWSVSDVAVRPVNDAVIATPDGSRLLRIATGSGDLSLDFLDGTTPRRLGNVGLNGSATWSADGKRVLFTKGPALSAMESIPLTGGSSSIVFEPPRGQRIADPGLHLPDGRLLTILRDTQADTLGIWVVQIDSHSGIARGSPRRLAEWEAGGANLGPFVVGLRSRLRLVSASADARRVVVKYDMGHEDIFVARFDEHQGRLLDAPRRITSDERGSFPSAWTPDGSTILFNLGQSGSQDIYTQRLDAESSEPLVVGRGDQFLPRVSSDGHWVLFQESLGAEGSRVMRVPLAGGRPEQVLATSRLGFPRCAARGRCVMFERDGTQWIISSLDPVGGKGGRLCSIPFSIRGEDVSPEGDAVALVVDDSRPPNRIRLYSLRGEPLEEIAVDNVTALVNLDWSGTGAGFFSTNLAPGGTELIFVRLDGTSHVVWSHDGIPVVAIPSPDGTHLAIAGWTRKSNVWMLTDF